MKGTGSSVPEQVLSNSDLEKMVETSDEWIITRTGIRERRISALPVVDPDGYLVGIITARDFMGIAGQLLDTYLDDA